MAGARGHQQESRLPSSTSYFLDRRTYQNAWYHDLATGTVATWVSDVWGASTISSNAPQTSGDWRVAPIPQWSAGQNADGNWGGSTTVVIKDTKHPKEATGFAMWLNTNQDSIEEPLAIDELLSQASSLHPRKG